MEQPIILFTGVAAEFALQALDFRRSAFLPGWESERPECLQYAAESFRSARKWAAAN